MPQPQITAATAPTASARAPRRAPRRSATSTPIPQRSEMITSGSPSPVRPSKVYRASRCRPTSPTDASAPVTTAATHQRRRDAVEDAGDGAVDGGLGRKIAPPPEDQQADADRAEDDERREPR